MKVQNPPSTRTNVWSAVRSPDTTQPFQQLVPLNWRGELLLTCCGMLLSFLVAGFWYPYWRVADMDFWMVYNALLLNVPLPQEYFDHPGYLSILLLSYWLRALHSLDIVHVISLSALPPASDASAFTQAWTAATRAGRVLSLIVAMSFAVSFAYLLRTLVRDWRIGAFGAFLLAFSGGMAMEMRIMRTELLAAAFFSSALLMLLIVAQRDQRWWRPAVVGCASLLITLALLNKIQFFFLVCALPVLLLPFGTRRAERGFWDEPRRAWLAFAGFIAAAASSLWLAKDILHTGFFGHEQTPVPMAALRFGASVYWPVLALWIGLGMTAFAVLWRVSVLEMVAVMAAALAGCMTGLLALDIRNHANDVAVVFHPLEYMLTWAMASEPQLSSGTLLGAAHLKFLLQSVIGVFARRTFVLSSSPRPTIFLEWFVITATIIAIRRREWRLVLQVGALMLVDWGIDTLSMARGLKQEYFLLTDPLAIIAAALLIAKFSDLQTHRWTYPIGVALIAAHVVVSQAEPVKHLFSSDGPEVLCGLYHKAKRVEHLPVCKTQ